MTRVDSDNDPEDCHGHGTHVAGTAVGTTYGVAKAATVVGVRVSSCSGSGSTSGVVAGTGLDSEPTTALTTRVNQAVANMSLGGGASSALDAAVQALVDAGVTMVVAAGNSSADAQNYSPARVADAITVGSTTSSDSRSYFSNYGSRLDLFAPGSNILSASMSCDTCSEEMSGTSMASPHAAGAAGLTPRGQPQRNPCDSLRRTCRPSNCRPNHRSPKRFTKPAAIRRVILSGVSRPQVTDISPNMGPYSGGQSVTINGNNFTDATSVEIGGTPASGVTVVSDSQITATTPTLGAAAAETFMSSTQPPNEIDPIAAAKEKINKFGAATSNERNERLPRIQANAVVENAGCSTFSLGRTDDWGTHRNPALGFDANWFGTSYDKIQINNNGGISFDNNHGSFSDYRGVVLGTTTRPVILPLFTDVDTRNTSTSPNDARTNYVGWLTCLLRQLDKWWRNTHLPVRNSRFNFS